MTSDRYNDGTTAQTVAASAKYEPDGTNDLRDGTDFTILTLSSAAPAWATQYGLFDGDPTGMLATMVGYGYQGVGSTGWTNTSASRRWAAENIVDAYGAAFWGAGTYAGTSNIINTDFDDGTAANNTLFGVGNSATMISREGTTAPGDSGGALLLEFGGSYYVSGVLSGGTTSDSVYGDISWWTGLPQFRSVIEQYGGSLFHVPAPATLALLGSGLAGLAATRRRKAH